MLQFREGAERQQCGLPLLALIGVDRLSALQDRHILAAACAVRIDVQHLAGQCLVDEVQNTGLGRDACHIHVLLAGTDAGLHDRIFAVSHSFYLQQPALMACLAVVAGELRHRITGVAVLILHHMIAARYDLTLNDIFRIGNGVFADCQAGAQLHRTLAQRTGNAQFIEAQGGRGGFKASGHLDGGVYADRNADGQRLAQFGSTLCHGTDMAAARLQENGQLVLGLDAHPVDGHIRAARVRMGGITHPQRDVRTGIHRRIGGRGHQLEQVKFRVGGTVHHFLTRGRFVGDNGLNGVLGTLTEQIAQFLLLHAKQVGYPLAAGQHANGNACVRVSRDIMKHHGWAVHLGRAHHGAARAHIAVHTGKLCLRVYLHICFHQLTRCLAQHVQGGTQV